MTRDNIDDQIFPNIPYTFSEPCYSERSLSEISHSERDCSLWEITEVEKEFEVEVEKENGNLFESKNWVKTSKVEGSVSNKSIVEGYRLENSLLR